MATPKPKPKPTTLLHNFTLTVMASLFSLFIFLLFISTSARHHRGLIPSDGGDVNLACKATRFPETCQKAFSTRPPKSPSPVDIIGAAISVSADNLQTAKKMVASIKDSSEGNLNRSSAAEICSQVLDFSNYRTQSTVEAVTRGKIKDARAWFSAALAYQYECSNTLKYVNNTKLVGDTMSFLDTLLEMTSNGLSLIWSLDNFGPEVGKWTVPKTERDGFWEKAGGDEKLSFDGRVPRGLKVSVTVCKEGCDYSTVQAAVNAAPVNKDEKFVVYIKAGSYVEKVRVPFDRKNVVFLGDGIGKTVISGDAFSGQPGITTYESATVGVLGDGFMAANLTFANTAGPDAHQAVAFRSDSDLSVIENCEFLGNQDTLYPKTLRQFYINCRIQGNVDFIFGNAAVIFQNCVILVAPRQLKPEHGEKNALTAHGRTDPAQASGFVFQNCLINGTEEYMKYYNEKPKVHRNFLGRPWKAYSRTVFINCKLEPLISPEGWLPWSGDLNLKTLYYGEFGNSGPGSDRASRVSWSNQIPEEHVAVYSVKNFIQGEDWIPTSA